MFLKVAGTESIYSDLACTKKNHVTQANERNSMTQTYEVMDNYSSFTSKAPYNKLFLLQKPHLLILVWYDKLFISGLGFLRCQNFNEIAASHLDVSVQHSKSMPKCQQKQEVRQ